MNPDKQRIAIAEACGIVSKDKWGSLYKTPRGIMRDCPDYLNDLNAMQSSVQSQSERFQDDFDSALKNSGKWVASMTAQEWADIFILCLQSQRDSGNSTP